MAPNFAGVRSAAMDTRLLSNLRMHGQVFAHYGNDFHGYTPFLADPRATYSVLRCESRQYAVVIRYWDVAETWQVSLADSYYDGNPFSNVFNRRDDAGLIGAKSWVVLPYVFESRPEYWNMRTRTSALAQAGPTRLDEVVFPGQKTLLLAEYAYPSLVARSIRAPQPAAFVDGRAAIVHPNQFAEAGPRSTEIESYRPTGYRTTDIDMFFTQDGVRGRDVR